ncbi:DUF3488 and transglutaminase-like domain-containing protein [Methylovorus sp. MP688]|uniref:transglutaminase TgpA family protein n=1 Tax=Methylovorus sp. (strain MP688) TaxID=887061 RepID=UPI0001EC4590|nr:DUF3488 and transglutaminase-like domain-containing protein [Methylovorus sp. MP688]ADQ84181.1 transglutaminase domain protein [Methylovorus sp. MP688]
MSVTRHALRNFTPQRHDVIWLLLSLLAVWGLHIAHLPLWINGLMALIFGWRWLIESRGWSLPRMPVLLPLTLLGIAGIVASFDGLFGRDASVALLTLMLGLKLLESRSSRDFMLVIFIAYFLTVNAFLFGQSMLVAAGMLIPVTGLTAALIGLQKPQSGSDQGLQLRLALTLLGQAIPLMLVLFVLFPRLPGPLWGVPKDSYKSMTGLSDRMRPGDISELSLSGATAFRVSFVGAPPRASQLYWRGPVFGYFDGREWRADRRAGYLPRESLSVRGEPVRYSVTLEPHNQPWMLVLDMPSQLPAGALASPDLQILAREPVRTRIRYEGVSHLDYTLADQLSPVAERYLLQLPQQGNPKSRALAEQWRAQLPDHQAIVDAALRMFRQQNFYYTLTPPPLGTNSIDDFLFNSRRGFCEHYAGSFAFLMRAAGIPARVVTGYQGGELNPVGQYMIVRQSDAHAWTEVWLPNRGWVRVDPTAAVSPSRIEAGIASAISESASLPLLARRDYPLLRKLYLNWDAINNGWNQWVLGYNQQKQAELLSRIFGASFPLSLLTALFIAVTALVLGLISWVLLRDKTRRDPLQQVYARFLRKMARAGLQQAPEEGAQDFSHRAQQQLPMQAAQIAAITALYLQLRYGRPSAASLQMLKRQIRNL